MDHTCAEPIPDEDLTDYLGKTNLTPQRRSEIERQLIECDACRDQLALYMEVLSDNQTPEETAALEELQRLIDRKRDNAKNN
jgi:hypothetical protein